MRMANKSITPSLGAAGLMIALFFLVLGTKFMVIDRYGSDLPEWDQWDAEGLHTLLPWKQGKLAVADLFRPHNEHRIVLTKVLGLLEVAVNGQWDSRLQCVVNSVLHALLAVGFFAAGQSMLPGRWHAPWFLFLAALFGLPLAWQNVIAGFHSQQYFLLGFSVLALWLLPFHPPHTAKWWIGLAAALLAFFSMGSGFLAASAVLVVLVLDLLYRHRSWEQVRPTLVAGLTITALGWFTRVTVDYHDSLKAKSVGDFLIYTINNLRWPARDSGWFALLLWTPWLAVTLRYLFRALGANERAPMRLAAIGGWVLLQVLASAYARGAGAGEPASRYMDTLALGLVVNGFALAWLCAYVSLSTFVTLTRTALALAWISVAALGLYQLNRANFVNELDGWVGAYHDEGEWRTRAYLATGRRSFLESDKIPYPGAGAYIERINHSELRAILPVSVRPPLALTESANDGFMTTDFSKIGPPVVIAGLAPETPQPRHGVTRGTFGITLPARWESQPVTPSSHAWLVFHATGLFDERTRIQLLDAATRRTVAILELTPGAHTDSWQEFQVAAPSRPFLVVVEDESSNGWIAFTAPVEMARLSGLAATLTAHGLWFVWAGVGLAVISSGVVLLARNRHYPATLQV